jgi:hypothetical protein
MWWGRRWFGYGGRGWGWGCRWFAPGWGAGWWTPEVEKQWLKEYEAYLETELRLVRERLAQLEGRPPAPPAGV